MSFSPSLAILTFVAIISATTGQTTTEGESFACPYVGLFAHPEDCHKFYYCSETDDGELVAEEMYCPEGMFSKGRRTCVPEGKVHCQEALMLMAPRSLTSQYGSVFCSDDCTKVLYRIITPNGDVISNTLKSCDTAKPEYCTLGGCKSVKDPNTCKTDMYACVPDGPFLNFPDPKYCGGYFVCSPRVTRPAYFNCTDLTGDSFIFNPDDWDKLSPCTLNNTDDNCRTTNLPENVCQNGVSGPHPVENFCEYFYYCEPSRNPDIFQVTMYHCDTGQGFSPSSKKCVPLSQIPECSPRSGNCVTEGYFQEKKDNCTRNYYVCLSDQVSGNLTKIPEECKNNMIFDSVTKKCKPSVGYCPSCSGKSDGLYPFGSECSANYYICVNGRMFPQNCSSGQVYDPATQNCDSRENVPSCNGGFITDVPINPTTNPTFQCPMKVGKYPDPDPLKCNLIHYCIGVRGQIIDKVVTCPAGKIYDPVRYFCVPGSCV